MPHQSRLHPYLNNRTLTDVDQQCAEGHEGPLCNVCQEGFAASVTGICKKCVKGSITNAQLCIFFVVMFLLVAIALIFGTQRNRNSKDGLAASDQLKQENSREKPKKSIVRKAKTKFKILASTFQIISQFENILGLRFPSAFEKFCRFLSLFVNLTFNLPYIGCLVQTNFYSKLMLSTLCPIFMFIAIYILAKILLIFYKDNDTKNHIKDTAFSIFLTLTYLVYSSVSTTIFDTFNCAAFGDDATEFMMSDLSVDCGTSMHIKMQIYAGFMILFYPVGIPCLYFTLLFRVRERIQHKNREYDESLEKIAFLWDMYEPEKWW